MNIFSQHQQNKLHSRVTQEGTQNPHKFRANKVDLISWHKLWNWFLGTSDKRHVCGNDSNKHKLYSWSKW